MFDIVGRMHQDRTVKAPVGVLLSVFLLSACQPAAVTATASPTPVAAVARTSAPPTASARPPATPTATLPPASPSPSPAATVAPGQACGRATGGNAAGGSALGEVRFGTQPGLERIVFDFGAGALPHYAVEQATSFVAPSGQSVPVQGNAHVGIRLNGAGGMGTYRGPTSFRPGLPLIREVKLVEDFEGVLVWGVGLERAVCPRILVLSSPTRLVVDFAN